MAKRVGNIYLPNCNYTCLYNAYRKAAKGKRYRGDVLQFTDNLEGNLLALLDDLKNHTYTVGAYLEFYVYEPKKRLIMALPFRDRVAQWWVYSLLYPIFDKTFIEDSYACRRGKGQKAAADRLQDMLKQAEILGGKWYYLKLDIAKYFYRIYHDKLMEILERKMPLALAKIQGKDAEDLNLSLNELQYMFFLGFHPDMVQSAAEELLQLDVIYK